METKFLESFVSSTSRQVSQGRIVTIFVPEVYRAGWGKLALVVTLEIPIREQFSSHLGQYTY